MSNLKILRQRIQSITATKKITSAMKLIATSHFKKLQKQRKEAVLYTQNVHHILEKVLAHDPLNFEIPLLIKGRPGQKHLMLVLGSDKGLCGGFNPTVIKYAVEQAKITGDNVKFLCIGQKVLSTMPSNLRSDVLDTLSMESQSTYKDSGTLAHLLQDFLLSGAFDKISLVHNHFKSIICYVPTIQSLVPLARAPQDNAPILFGVEPNLNELLESLAFKNLTATLYYACLESHMSEHSARMMAMDSSTRNAEDMLHALKTTYHRSRQAMITNELIEIIAGAEAL